MVIAKAAVEKFRNRQLDDYDWVKDVSESDLDEELNNLIPKPDFHTPPFAHQKAAFLVGVNQNKFLYFLDMDTGKTKLVLDLLSYKFKCEEIGCALVLVPNLVNISGWEQEIDIHAPSLSAVSLIGTLSDRLALFDTEADIFIINYAGLVAMCTTLVKARRGTKKVRAENLDLIKTFTNKFDAIIFDESTAVKNHRSLTFRVGKALAARCTARYALTGTPFGRDPGDLWPQFNIIDGGETLGQTLGIFREAFFKQKKNYWGGYEYTLVKKREPLLYHTLKNKSLRYSLKEVAGSLPAQTFVDTYVESSDTLDKMYQDEINKVIKSGGDYKMMKNCFVHMRMLTSGFLKFESLEGETHTIDLTVNPKIEATMELVQALPHNCKMVIVHEFIHSGELIEKALTRLGIKSQRLWSGTKNKARTIERFVDAGSDHPILIMNHQSGSKGLNLQRANYMVFFESPVSPIDRDQTERRIYRTGQERPVFYYNLMMRGTIDVKIKAYLKQGKDLFRALVEGKEELV